eukprot:2932064-Rhodomonas_salina.1
MLRVACMLRVETIRVVDLEHAECGARPTYRSSSLASPGETLKGIEIPTGSNSDSHKISEVESRGLKESDV